MQQLYYYVYESSVLSHWNDAVGAPEKVLFSLQFEDIETLPVDGSLMMIQYQEKDQAQIEAILNAGYSVILFSNSTDQSQGFTWFQKGIKGYLNSYANRHLIQQAIEAVNTNNIWLGQNIMQAMIQTLQNMQPTIDLSWQEKLTDREVEVANAILDGQSNKDIAESLFITERTVKSHVHNLLEKFDVKDRLALVIKIQRMQTRSLNS